MYQIVRQDGAGELTRSANALILSGIAAGIAISTSLAAIGILHMKLPDASWRPLVTNFGYCTGFLIVVLGRLQLFTESTVTAVLPLLAGLSRRNLALVLRLWTLVFLANLVGTFVAVIVGDVVGLATPEQIAAFREVSRPLMDQSPWNMFLRSIPAGFWIASMVWMLPNCKGFGFWVIVLITYVIGVGDFPHVVVGSAKAFLLLIGGEIGIGATVFTFLVPAFMGNVIGGTALFSLLAYGQVRGEIR